ncbi:glycosyltransferase family 2 protein [Polaribacter septentrionalilitoris]|uniref:glycosyltransferase family 2 protein n=1 Tax=Polaribacter septentrionalilitoris TaxID=2494657 RepID=UPI00135BF226|nr:glycosyltransferase family 2 protein [Polaribacter septentrionalilitoris]
MDNQPLITIILTTYNRAHLIDQMLDSLLLQSYKNWECIIIDDNSKDDTSKVVSKITDKDHRFQFIIKSEEIKQGLPASRNIGIKKAEGDFLVFFDDDDILHPQLLEICINEFIKNKNIDFVHYQKKSFQNEFCHESIEFIDDYSCETLNENVYENVIIGKLPLASCTVMWKINLLQNNLFNENLMYAEEWECYSRILISNLNIRGLNVKIPLYFNRKHIESNTGEFWSNNPIRLESYKLAHQLTCEFLLIHKKMSTQLAHYFIQKAYQLKSKKITKVLLSKYLKYKFYSLFFPIKYKFYKLQK